MKPVMYLFLNRGLGMSTGKAAAQAAHAAVEAYTISDSKLVGAWESGGHYTKIVFHAEDETQLGNIEQYLNERGFKTRLIIDEGRTEIKPFTKTALGVEIVDKDVPHVLDTFSEFKTYKDLKDPKKYIYTAEDVTEAFERGRSTMPDELLSRKGRKSLKG
jgi:peptidyl-tRNA hydrolase